MIHSKIFAGSSEVLAGSMSALGTVPLPPPVSLIFANTAGSNVGELTIPSDLPAGKYPLTVTAEDIAHNIGSEEVSVEVVP